jgi:hypothetical protein
LKGKRDEDAFQKDKNIYLFLKKRKMKNKLTSISLMNRVSVLPLVYLMDGNVSVKPMNYQKFEVNV